MSKNLEARVRAERLDYGLFEDAPRAVAWLRETAPIPARLRVVGDDDSDGATSAHVLSTALRRAGYEVETALQPVHDEPQLDAALSGSFDAWVIADAGSTFVPQLERRGRPVLVVDHHAVSPHQPGHVFEINPRRAGGNRTWGVSASIVSLLVALAMDEKRNWDLAPAAIAGAISDRQHLGGFHGLAGYAIDGAEREGLLRKSIGFTLDGPSVLDAVTTSLDPYFSRFAGDGTAARAFLEGLGIDPAADPLDVEGPVSQRLAQALESTLGTAALEAERIFPLHGDRLLLPGQPMRTVLEMSRLLEAATAEGAHGVALAVLSGRTEAVDEARILARHRQGRILREVARLRDAVQYRQAFRWVETQDAPNTGVYGHVLHAYVFGTAKPMLVFAPTPEGFKVSARASSRLYLAGLDMAKALSRASSKVGGHGGGHPGAAGATLPAGSRDAFLKALDSQLSLSKEAA